MRKILSLLEVAAVTRIDPVVLARSYLNPRGEQTMGRVGVDTSNADEDAALDVIAVQAALQGARPRDVTSDQIAARICPWAVPIQNPREVDNGLPGATEESVSDRHGPPS